MTTENLTYTSIYGNIDYTYIEDAKYENGLIVLNGAIVEKEYRGTGKFKVMLKDLLSKFSDGTVIQAAVITKKLTEMFKRMGMEKVDRIEVWGSPANCTLLQGTLTKSSLTNL